MTLMVDLSRVKSCYNVVSIPVYSPRLSDGHDFPRVRLIRPLTEMIDITREMTYPPWFTTVRRSLTYQVPVAWHGSTITLQPLQQPSVRVRLITLSTL
jgi:hypothetical protein